MIPHILDAVGGTPCISFPLRGHPHVNLFIKAEFANPTGSVKDRAACYLIKHLLEQKTIAPGWTIVESSSGNWAIALASVCKQYGIGFHAVIDPNINPLNEMLIRLLSTHVTKVTERDQTGGFLLTRIEAVKQCLETQPKYYWANQYGNPLVSDAYFHTLGVEICADVNPIDYFFIGVSSCGTITGLSRKVKDVYPQSKIVAVDIVGSVIFGGPPKKRFIAGIGSSMVPEQLKHAIVDDVVMVDEVTTCEHCHELLKIYNIFAGGSSGSVYAAVKRYFVEHPPETSVNAVMILADRGDRYGSTVYDEKWVDSLREYEKHPENGPNDILMRR